MSGGKITETDRFIIDDESEEILVRLSDGETRHYKVKPMNELFGAGTGVSSFHPRDEMFIPLLLPIEETILEYWDESPGADRWPGFAGA